MNKKIQVTLNSDNNTYVLKHEEKLIISYNEPYKTLYCSKDVSEEDIQIFLEFLRKHHVLSIKVAVPGGKDQTIKIEKKKKNGRQTQEAN